jgi:hypothetical protein
VCDGDFAPGFVVDGRFDVLDQGSGAIDVQNLQAVADAKDGLARTVCVLQQEFIDGVALCIRVGGLRVTRLVVFGRVHVGTTAGEQNGVARFDQLHQIGRGRIQRDPNGIAAGDFDGVFVLRQGAAGVLGISGVWDSNGNSWAH